MSCCTFSKQTFTEHPHSKRHLAKALGFPGGVSGKEPACQCRGHERHGFDSWVGKFPWRMAQKPTPVFLLENPMEKGAKSIQQQRVRHNWSNSARARTHTRDAKSKTWFLY